MAVQLSEEQLGHFSSSIQETLDIRRGDTGILYGDRNIVTVGGQNHLTDTSSHEYELNQSESLSFLYNLLYDDSSELSKADILGILNSLKLRKDNSSFSVDGSPDTDNQGVSWPTGLREKFCRERERIGNRNWFHNIPNSREMMKEKLNLEMYNSRTEFFRFHKFYSKLKLHIIHFQLRNLVCACPRAENGIFYPLSHHYYYNQQTLYDNTDSDECLNFFKVNRLMTDDLVNPVPEAKKLDCILDSRALRKNVNSRVSTMTCSNNLLACGTFEGGMILLDISDSQNLHVLREYSLTPSSDGITNHAVINNDKELIISCNDNSLRLIDIQSSRTRYMDISFAINCLALNPFNSNECFVTGDHVDCFILDKRSPVIDINKAQSFEGHKDYGFSCDWCPADENLLMSGNQDSCVKIWDKRNSKESLYCWSSSLGKSGNLGGPVRNCKFNRDGKFIVWAESLDHVGILETNDLIRNENYLDRIQSVDFIGKCTGLNFSPIDSGNGEELIIGVSDCPLGGILSYRLQSSLKSLDFDFIF